MSFDIKRGVNLHGWETPRKPLARLRRIGRNVKKPLPLGRDDLHRIADWGLDHVRLPMMEVDLFDEDGKRIQAGLDRLNLVVNWCESAGLRIVADMHKIRSHDRLKPASDDLFGDPKKVPQFLFLWSELSAILGKRSNETLAYDLLNEIVTPNPEDWNRILGLLVAQLRDLEPERVLIFGPNLFRDINNVPTLRIPPGTNQNLAFHFYSPHFLTHYGMTYTPMGAYKGAVQYPGRPIPDEWLEKVTPDAYPRPRGDGHWNRHWSQAVMAASMAEGLHIARQKGIPLYCAEFGCSRLAPLAARQAWLRDCLEVLVTNGIPYCIWNYRSESYGLLGDNDKASEFLSLVLAAK